ncbi:lysophospholipid acyltransferase family protein [Flammeovirgaceae bacterium SG7u.111]|nr:lysophospholipid acyltransferase family protein [Flammeovirgaceae bacterium SG7u.132]WPO36730.1 lysophospholipid acyltransferase family protein [Flammeovirgaceae bacterium SG7u.111]
MVFLLKLLSRLPFPVLYLLADFLNFIAYRVIKYRRDVVWDNISKCFPEKNEEEVAQIVKGFYRNFSDTIVEILKSFTISREDFLKRVSLVNKEAMGDYLKNNQPVVAVLSHQTNWEWVNLGTSALFQGEVLKPVYKTLSNKTFDKLIFDMRAKFGAQPLEMKLTFRDVIKNRKNTQVIGLVADQTPGIDDDKYWINFLGRETAFYTGAQKIAEIGNFPVVFFGIRRLKRGKYEIFIQKIAEGPYEKGGQEIVEKFAKATEDMIRKAPSDWLWSHNRWKYTKEESDAKRAITEAKKKLDEAKK